MTGTSKTEVQITPGLIRGTVDEVIREMGDTATTRAVAAEAAGRLCNRLTRRVGRDERDDLEAACLSVVSEE